MWQQKNVENWYNFIISIREILFERTNQTYWGKIFKSMKNHQRVERRGSKSTLRIICTIYWYCVQLPWYVKVVKQSFTTDLDNPGLFPLLWKPDRPQGLAIKWRRFMISKTIPRLPVNYSKIKLFEDLKWNILLIVKWLKEGKCFIEIG